MGKLLSGELKAMFKGGLGGILAYLLIRNRLNAFKKRFDAKEHGGAPILGLNKTVIKAHGSSDAKAFSNAIRQAINCVELNVVDIIAKEAEKLNAERLAVQAEAEESSAE
jgi:glycerol-3-phosphate acyltransferase PlsX